MIFKLNRNNPYLVNKDPLPFEETIKFKIQLLSKDFGGGFLSLIENIGCGNYIYLFPDCKDND